MFNKKIRRKGRRAGENPVWKLVACRYRSSLSLIPSRKHFRIISITPPPGTDSPGKAADGGMDAKAGSTPAPPANRDKKSNTMTTKKNMPAEKPAAVPKGAAIKALNEIPAAAEDAIPDLYSTQTTTASSSPDSAASPVADTAEPTKPDLFDSYLVVIPYFAAGAQGRELEYCIEGWRRHFNEPYHIVVVGDRHPVVDSGSDITFIDCPRVEVDDTQYTPHRDFVNKLRKVRAAFPDSDGFIFCGDDVYAVNNFDIADVRFLKAQGDEIRFDNNATGACFETEKRKTKAALEADGYPTRNYTTHLPQWLEWGKLEALWDKYDGDRRK